MKNNFLQLIEESLDLDSGSLKGEEKIADIGWDSLSFLGFIAISDEKFNINISPTDIQNVNTVNDLVDILSNKIKNKND